MTECIRIANREIGVGYPPYIIAELSGNHNGNLTRAISLLEEAKNAGVDAVKLQTYTADTITINHNSADFCIDSGLWAGKTLYELYDQAHTPWEWHEALFQRASELGMTIFSSPFDETAVDFLESLNVPAYKIASFELLDIPLIRRIGATGKPIIISSGLASESEIGEALDAARSAGANQITLLHCVSGYPTPADEVNLLMIPELSKRFSVPVGLSDHTIGTIVSVAAVALGACVIEKHLTLARNDGGPDAAFSLEPGEFLQLTTDCRMVWEALGRGDYQRSLSEVGNSRFRRSLYVVEDIAAGDEFTCKNIRSIRPGYGLSPKYLPGILGCRAALNLKRGTRLSLEVILPIDKENKSNGVIT